MSWTRDQVSTLIEEYMKYPCLYAVKTKAYSNKHLRQQALEQIRNTLMNLKPTVTIMDIKTKFAGLKQTFLNEYRKHLKSVHSGADEEEIYYPNLWYYEKLTFILDHVEPRKSTDSITMMSQDEDIAIIENFEEENDTMVENIEEYIVSDDGSVSRSSESEAVESVYSRQSGAAPKKKRCRSLDNGSIIKEATSVLQVINKTLAEPKTNQTVVNEDDAALANFIISKLAQITDYDVRIDTEENIAKCLYEAIKKCKKYI